MSDNNKLVNVSREAEFVINSINESGGDIDALDNATIAIDPKLDHERLNTLMGVAMGSITTSEFIDPNNDKEFNLAIAVNAVVELDTRLG